MAHILTQENPPRVLCKAGPAWPVRWQQVQERDGVLEVPKDALRYPSDGGAIQGATIYGGTPTQV